MSRFLLALSGLAWLVQPVRAADPPLATVLERAGTYVADFHRHLSAIVAEEHYRTVRGTITVSDQSEPALGMLLPVEMRERYEGRRSKVLVDASASYGHFRQFQVSVDETFAPLRKP